MGQQDEAAVPAAGDTDGAPVVGGGPRILLIGFSNTLMFGYAPRVGQMFFDERPDVEIVRVGLGAQQPHVVPSFIRLAQDLRGPFSHVMLEINTSAFTFHRLSNDALARDLLADIVLTAQEIGAEPGFLILYRDYHGKTTIDFNAITRDFCAHYEIPMLDLAEGLLADRGPEFVRSILRDDVHTTPEGSRFLAEQVAPFMFAHVERTLQPRRPQPRQRRSYLDLGGLLPAGQPTHSVEVSKLTLDYAEVAEGASLEIDLGREREAIGLTYLYGPSGGLADLVFGAGGQTPTLASVDAMSHAVRLAVHPFNSFLGARGRTIAITNVRDAPDIAMLRAEKTPPVRQYIGPLMTIEPAED